MAATRAHSTVQNLPDSKTFGVPEIGCHQVEVTPCEDAIDRMLPALELSSDLLSHLIATGADGGPNAHHQAVRPAFGVVQHPLYSLAQNVGCRALPPGVDQTDPLGVRVDDQGGYTVGAADDGKQSWPVKNPPIPLRTVPGVRIPGAQNVIGMDLL